MSLINALSNVSDNLDERVNIRKGFLESNIVQHINKMREEATDNEELITQFDVFLEELQNDEAELQALKSIGDINLESVFLMN